MKNLNVLLAGSAVALGTLCLAAPARAGLMTETIDFFPDEPGSFLRSLRFLRPELEGRRIVETRLFLTFNSEPGFDAGDFFIALTAPVTPDPGAQGFIFLLSGDDLGWSGQGTFNAQRTLTDLNGVLFGSLWQFDLFPDLDPAIFDGSFSADSRFEINTVEVPAPAPATLTIAGGTLLLRRRHRAA